MTPEQYRQELAINQASSQIAIQSQVSALRRILHDSFLEQDRDALAQRSSNEGFRKETKKALEAILLNLGDKDPDFVQKIVERLNRTATSSDGS